MIEKQQCLQLQMPLSASRALKRYFIQVARETQSQLNSIFKQILKNSSSNQGDQNLQEIKTKVSCLKIVLKQRYKKLGQLQNQLNQRLAIVDQMTSRPFLYNERKAQQMAICYIAQYLSVSLAEQYARQLNLSVLIQLQNVREMQKIMQDIKACNLHLVSKWADKNSKIINKSKSNFIMELRLQEFMKDVANGQLQRAIRKIRKSRLDVHKHKRIKQVMSYILDPSGTWQQIQLSQKKYITLSSMFKQLYQEIFQQSAKTALQTTVAHGLMFFKTNLCGVQVITDCPACPPLFRNISQISLVNRNVSSIHCSITGNRLNSSSQIGMYFGKMYSLQGIKELRKQQRKGQRGNEQEIRRIYLA